MTDLVQFQQSDPALAGAVSGSAGAKARPNPNPSVDSIARWGFVFSPDGGHAACMAMTGREVAVEVWNTVHPVRRCQLPTPHARFSRLGVGDDGTVLVLVRAADQARLLRIPPDSEGPIDAEWRVFKARNFFLVPGTTDLAVSHEGGETTLWRLPMSEEPFELGMTHGLLTGGLALDIAGRRVAFNRLSLGHVSQPVWVDAQHGSCHPLTPGHTGLQLLLTDPGSGALAFAAGLPSSPHLVVSRLDQAALTAGRLEPLSSLNDLEGDLRPLAFDGGGAELYCSLNRGVRSHLVRHEVARGTTRRLDTPLGVISGPAAVHGGVLRFAMTAPDRPEHLVSHPPRLSDSPRPAAASAAHVEVFETPGGHVEALVFGESWATARRLLVALHGGPEDRWRAEYTPQFLRLADRGICVVAVNQRGSTGYGRAHREAIHHAWGGPDLADIHAIADHIVQGRVGHADRRLMAYGASYGAYLALLAASTQPNRWSHCVAVAPFLSAEQLYAEGAGPVRRLLERTGARTPVCDEFGPRDLLRATRTLRARTLLVHGSADRIIPVTHSRRLHEQLRTTGECASLEYVELPDAGHDPRKGGDADRLEALIAAHLLA
ncbi:alpha/beta fold hydrolase [Streptomyces sp. Lzd4kr]|nr:alpha/beta fold hydrolase [Streptomyces sp. Lzd4kr]